MYNWSVTGAGKIDNFFNPKGQTCSIKAIKRYPGDNKTEVLNIATNITDHDGDGPGADSQTKAITVHDYCETQPGSSSDVIDQSKRQVLTTVTIDENTVLPVKVTVKASTSWEFGGSVEVAADFGPVNSKVGLSAKRTFANEVSVEFSITGNIGDSVDVLAIPSYTEKKGSYKIWEIGLARNPSWTDQSNERVTYTTNLSNHKNN